jgi:long-subunit acyl-CoA synthetase (AMP-forming)
MANILTTLVSRQTRKYADRPAVYRRDPQGQWIAYSWNEMAAMVDQASCALEILGINETEKIAVLGKQPQCSHNRFRSIRKPRSAGVDLCHLFSAAG